jgi:hypothetical protein
MILQDRLTDRGFAWDCFERLGPAVTQTVGDHLHDPVAEQVWGNVRDPLVSWLWAQSRPTGGFPWR